MGRIDIIEIANTRPLVISSEVEVPITTNPILEGKCIHDGVLEFPNVFPNETTAIIRPVAYKVVEYEPNGSLQKKNLVICFYRNSLIGVTAGQIEKVSNQNAITGIEISLGTGNSIEYKNSDGVNVWAVRQNSLEGSGYYIEKDASNSLYFVVRAGESVTYTSNTKLYICFWFCIT